MDSHRPGSVPEAVLDDLRARLRSTRFVPLPQGVRWSRGTDPDYLAELVAHWADAYDWRSHEHRIRALPWVRTGEGPTSLRSVHQRAADRGAPVVVLLHGWPDSVLRFQRVLPLLADVHVVAPALPGFPFADELRTAGMSVTAMAEVVASCLDELGYRRYVVSGGDVSGDVAEQLAAAYPDRVAALHLTSLSPRHLRGLDPSCLREAERSDLLAARQWQLSEGGYLAVQSTRPHSLAPALGDSPAGLAAWLIEKLRAWSDCGGQIESVFPREDLLTWLTAYWVTGTIGSSFSPYVEEARLVQRVEAPTVMSIYAGDIKIASRELTERFLNVAAWTEHPTGGHFAAWEQPESYSSGLRHALRLGFT